MSDLPCLFLETRCIFLSFYHRSHPRGLFLWDQRLVLQSVFVSFIKLARPFPSYHSPIIFPRLRPPCLFPSLKLSPTPYAICKCRSLFWQVPFSGFFSLFYTVFEFEPPYFIEPCYLAAPLPKGVKYLNYSQPLHYPRRL